MSDNTGYSPNYGFRYPLGGASLSETAERIEQLARDIDLAFNILGVDLSVSAALVQEGDAAGGDLTGTYPNPTIASSAVTTSKINDAAVTTSKINDAAVTTAKINTSAVTTDKLDVVALKDGSTATTQAQSDGSTKIATTAYVDAYITGTIPSGSIDTNELADGAVTNAKVAADAAIAYSKLDLTGEVLEADLAFEIATQAELNSVASDLSDHEAATTSVHGIADTSTLETQTGAQSKADTAESNAASYTDSAISTHEAAADPHPQYLTSTEGNAAYDALGAASAAQSAAESYADSLATNYDPAGSASTVAGDLSTHESATTSVHGISDTSNLVYTSDSRLSDARTPTTHASTHEPGGSDALDLTTINGIGASLPTLPDSGYPAGALFGVGSVAPYLLYRSTGSAWDQIGGAGGSSVTTDDTAPVSPSDGDLWYDSTSGKTFVWYEDGSSDQWVEVGNASQLVIPQHGADHVRGGSDIIDGDRLTVDYAPSTYSPNSGATGAGDNTDLAAHLSGIDNTLAGYAPAYRNVIINGAMQVHQRGTSAASITSDAYYTADRFITAISSTGAWTQSIENDAPADRGFQKSLKMLCTTADSSLAAGDYLIIAQRFEGQNLQHFIKGTSNAKKFAVSFWVKSNVTGTYICELFDNDNSRQVSASYSISASDTWEKKTIVFPADTTGILDNDNNQSLRIQFWLAAGSTYTSGTLNTSWDSNTNANRVVGQTNLAAATNNYWQVTGVQLEPEVVTPFEFEPFETTLRKCQRYYEKSYDVNVNPGTVVNDGWTGTFSVGSTTSYIGSYTQYKVTKKSDPAVTIWDPAGNINKCQRWTLGVSNNNNQPIVVDASSGTSGFFVYSTGTTNNTSIGYHWVANAEL